MRLPPLLLAACFALPVWVGAQPSAPGTAAATMPVLTLPEALRLARENVDVALARRAAEAARADVTSADHAPAPVLSAKASSIDLQNGVGGGNVFRDKRIDKALGVDWTWERGNKRELRTRAAARTAEAAQLDLAEVTVQQQLAVASAFHDLAAAQERVEQIAGLERSASDLAAASGRRQRAGDISQQESLRTEIEARRAVADLRAAQADRQRAMLVLGQLVGQRGDFRVEPAWPAASGTPDGLPDIDQRADVQAAQRRVEAARAAFDNALALRRNDVTVGTSLDHYPGTSRRLLELRVSVPLAGVLGSYNYEGEIAKARAALDQADDQLEKTRRAALADSGKLLEDLRAAAQRAAEYDTGIVPRARQVAQMAELAYSKGALPLVDLVDARRTLRNVLLDDIAARADFARAHAAWQLRQATTP